MIHNPLEQVGNKFITWLSERNLSLFFASVPSKVTDGQKCWFINKKNIKYGGENIVIPCSCADTRGVLRIPLRFYGSRHVDSVSEMVTNTDIPYENPIQEAMLTHKYVAQLNSSRLPKLLSSFLQFRGRLGQEIGGFIVEELESLPKKLGKDEINNLEKFMYDFLTELKREGLTYMDFKPENIMIRRLTDSSFEYVIADLSGISERIDFRGAITDFYQSRNRFAGKTRKLYTLDTEEKERRSVQSLLNTIRKLKLDNSIFE